MEEKNALEEEAKKFKEEKEKKEKRTQTKRPASRKPAPQSGKTDDRTTFAAAALSGLISASRDQREVQVDDIVNQSWSYADLMLAKQKEAGD